MIFDSVKQSRFSELPEDVGMLIFQLIAEVDRKTGLSCALVSQKVNAWCVYSWKDTLTPTQNLKGETNSFSQYRNTERFSTEHLSSSPSHEPDGEKTSRVLRLACQIPRPGI